MGAMGRGSVCALFLLACAGDDGRATAPWLTASETGDGTGAGTEADTGSESDGGPCPGVCTPGALETQPCAGQCGSQERTCTASCNWSEWSMCSGVGECTPGASETCGPCQERTCDASCQWGACADVECAFECIHSARNGSEICDDESFEMTDDPLYLVCVTDEGGVAYVSSNTGPKMADCVNRCQGWEVNGQDAWDFLEYLQMMDCDQPNEYVEIELQPGESAWFGVHDQPAGGGHFTEVCIAHLAP